jgi:Sap, sulfolipid-1-addressing protein
MGTAVGDLLPFGVGVALAPIPIIAVILLLFSRRPASNSLAFLVGWVAGLTILSVIVLAFARSDTFSSNGKESVVGGALRLLVGAMFLLLAFRQWRKRPPPGQKAEAPHWMSSLETLGPGKALGLGVLLSGLNVKNMMLTLAALLTLGEARLSGSQTLAALTVFIALSSVTVFAPVVVNLVLGERAAQPLGTSKAWLEANNATVMAVLLLVLGTVALGKGLATLVR